MLTANLLIGSMPGVIKGSTLSVNFSPQSLQTVMATMILING